MEIEIILIICYLIIIYKFLYLTFSYLISFRIVSDPYLLNYNL